MTLGFPPPEIAWTFTAFTAVLVLATIAVHMMKWRSPEKDFGELVRRVNSWWVIVVLFVAAVLLGRGASIAFFALASLLAFREYARLVPPRDADRRVLFWAYAAIPLQYAWAYIAWYGVFIIFIPVYMFLLLPVRAILTGETSGFLRATSALHWGLMTTTFSLSHAAYLFVLEPGNHPRLSGVWPSVQGAAQPGVGFAVLLVMLTELNDVFQYLWGKTLGRRKIVPRVSPNKTWAGFLGGVGTTTGLAVATGPLLTPMDWQHSAVAGAIIGLSGFFGDLSISMLKRDLAVKDAGTTLPGHGGVLDRVDSLTYTAPLYFHFVYYLYF
jgi:phosphatidate cytidylyltransferase